MDIDLTLSDFIKESCVYKDIRRCYDDHNKNEYMAMCHEGVIRFTEECESMMYDFTVYLDDIGAPHTVDNLADGLDVIHELMLWVAKLADTQFASSTLCMYLKDCDMEQTQLHIASYYPSFYNHIHDSGIIFPSVATALGLINS